MAQRGQRPARQPDMDEIGINSFLIHNAKVRPWLKGEGVLVGNHFELLTWRREGLVARLAMRGFNVRTIEERIRHLPPLPGPVPVGELCRRDLQQARERYAYFDPVELRWQEVEPEASQHFVQLREGWVLRRRRGRGRASYYQASCEKGGTIGLRPLSESDALLMGYAQATEPALRPVQAQSVAGGYQLPQQLVLPPPHRAVVKILSSRSQGSNPIPPEGLEHLRELLRTLGLTLQEPEHA